MRKTECGKSQSLAILGQFSINHIYLYLPFPTFDNFEHFHDFGDIENCKYSNRLSTRFVENTNRSRNHSCATQQWSGPMRAHVSCGSKVVLLVGLIFVLSCIALALATSSLQLTQSVVLEGASKDAQCPSFTLLLLLLLFLILHAN